MAAAHLADQEARATTDYLAKRYPSSTLPDGTHVKATRVGHGSGSPSWGGQGRLPQYGRPSSSPPWPDSLFSSASPPRAGYEQAGQDGLDDLAVAALATLPPQKAASILMKLRNKGGNVRNPSAYVVRSVENAHCHGGGGSLRPQPPPGAVYYVPYYNYGPPPPPDQSPPGFAPSPAAPAVAALAARRASAAEPRRALVPRAASPTARRRGC